MKLINKKEKSFLKKIVPIAALIGGLCCFTPVVLVLLGLSTVAYATSLSNTLYFGYAWAFRGAALLFLLGALSWYLYSKEQICSLDALKRKRRKVINLVLISILISVIAYIVWLYVVVEIMGIGLGIWGNPFS